MSGYKLVPMEPMAEMVEAAKDAYMPFGDMDLAIRMAILTAPDVQGEPVAWLVTKGRMFKDRAFISERGAKESAIERKDGAIVQPLYNAPQPAEQKPMTDAAKLVEALECALEIMENVDGANDCSRGINAAEEALAAHRKHGGGA